MRRYESNAPVQLPPRESMLRRNVLSSGLFLRVAPGALLFGRPSLASGASNGTKILQEVETG